MNEFQEINLDAAKEERKLICRQHRDSILSWEDAVARLKQTGLDDTQANDALLDANEESL